MAHTDILTAVLAELEQVLTEEHQALRALDRDAIERAGERKLLLDQKLREATRAVTPGKQHLDALVRVKRSALQNQLLLVHARASVQSVLSMVSGHQFSTYPGSGPARSAPQPVRVNVRG